MASFIQRIFGGGISPERREAMLAYMAAEGELQAIQDAAGGRYNNVLTKYGGSATPGTEAMAEIVSAAKQQSETYADLSHRHTELHAIPDEASGCYMKWEIVYLALAEWASAMVAAYEGIYEGATPHTGRLEHLQAAERKAEREARKEEAKLLRRTGISVGEFQRLFRQTGAAAQAEQEGNGGERSLALNFLRVLQWASARQQLALEEWNDELAAQATDPIEGDEILNPPIVELSEAHATRCLSVAERRLATAVSVRDEFTKLRDFEMPEALVVAVDAWARVFEIHLERCEKTVGDVRALAAGTRRGDNDEERRLVSEESQVANLAVAAQHAVMDQWRIDFAELQEMMFAACNDLRLELGKPKLSVDEFTVLYSSGMAGQRSRFYT